jgi:hypothetical protein
VDVGLQVHDRVLDLRVRGVRLAEATTADLRRRAERHGGRLVVDDDVVRLTVPLAQGAAPTP